jgi:signal transduction histidine kinase
VQLDERTSWLRRHKQRLIYAMLAAAVAVAVGAITVGGFLLHHAADIERQSLRTQKLAGDATELQGFSLRAASGDTKELGLERTNALDAANAAFQSVRRHDRAESDRIAPAYIAFLGGSAREFRQALQNGRPPIAEQRLVDAQLSRLETLIDKEIRRQAQETQVANPHARMALLLAIAAAALLVGLLIWQFRLEQKAGRIDRDNAARSNELIRIRDEFVAAVSHELRTPLTSIIGYLDLLSDNESQTLTPDQQTFITVAQRNSTRLYQLVGDLLLVAETDGTLALDLHPVDLDDLAAHCVKAARPAADAKQIDLSLTRGSAPTIEGDPVRLGQMMDNLVSNAIKFTPAGGRVHVLTGAEDGHVLFDVQDSGYGVSPAEQAQLFDRFYRARVAADQAITGTGLGLTITKAIVSAHHGSIEVESTLGEGSTFRVRLPDVQPLAPEPS